MALYGLQLKDMGTNYVFSIRQKDGGLKIYFCYTPEKMEIEVLARLTQHPSYLRIKKGHWEKYVGGFGVCIVAKTRVQLGPPPSNDVLVAMTKSANKL